MERLKANKAYDGRVKEMQPVWADTLRERIADAEARARAFKASAEDAKKKNMPAEQAEKMQKAAEDDAKKLKQQLDAGDFKELRQQWEQKEAYVADAFKLVANPNLCVKCHQVGTVPGLPASLYVVR